MQRGLLLSAWLSPVIACHGTAPERRVSDAGLPSVSPPDLDMEIDAAAEAEPLVADSGEPVPPLPDVPVDEEPAQEVPEIDSGVVPSAQDASVAAPVDAGDLDPCSNEDIRFARGVSVAELALYQTVKVSLVREGLAVAAREAPIVQGKRALVRVLVRPEAGFVARRLRAVLTVDNGAVQRFVSDLEVHAPSRDADLASGFNFDLDGMALGPRTTLRAALVETTCGGELGTPERARAPVSGAVALDAEAIETLRVHVVPTVINGHAASPTPQQLAKMRAALLALYPVPDVQLSVHAPYDLSAAWTCASGNGWSCALDAVVALRAREAPPSNVYYYALLTPQATYQEYCSAGCTLGVAYGNLNGSPRYQVGIGIGYANDLTDQTMVHELGHAHGRAHAPCAPGQNLAPNSIDEDYPSRTADTLGWGWDARDDTLHPPTDKDVMSYCDPRWISSYNYAAIAQRSQAVNLAAFVLGGAQTSATGESYRNLIVSAGGASFGEIRERGTPPGEPVRAEVLDPSGALLKRVTVYRALLSDETSMFLFVPNLPAGARALRVDGRTIVLPEA